MYSMVLVMSMAGAPEVPQFGLHKGNGGCYGSAPVAVASSGCFGCNGGCGGHGHGLFGGKLKGCFSCFKHKSHGCAGGVGGGVVVTEAAPGCGTVVIPPAPGTVVPGTVVPGTVVPGTAVPPPPVPMKPVDPKKMPETPKATPKIG